MYDNDDDLWNSALEEIENNERTNTTRYKFVGGRTWTIVNDPAPPVDLGPSSSGPWSVDQEDMGYSGNYRIGDPQAQDTGMDSIGILPLVAIAVLVVVALLGAIAGAGGL